LMLFNAMWYNLYDYKSLILFLSKADADASHLIASNQLVCIKAREEKRSALITRALYFYAKYKMIASLWLFMHKQKGLWW
jgi:hypothetical protein